MKDTKQNKVVNYINRGTGDKDKLHAARKNPNDEFYTSLNDITAELSHWTDKFIGKDIICPCDWDIFEGEDVYSLTVEFNEEAEECVWTKTWTINKIKKVTYQRSLWEPEEHLEEVVVTGQEAEKLMKERVTCNFLKCLISIGEEYGIHSITASGYDVENDRGIKFQDVDYSKYDICVTNPPFSVYSEFMKIMLEERDNRVNTDRPFNFVILAPMTNRANPCIGLPLMLHKMYLGYGRAIGMSFNNPDKNASYKSKAVCVDWITTYSEAQDEVDKTKMETNVDYNLYKDEFYEMENMTMKNGTHPIKVKSKKVIPDGYTGWMFSSVTILDNLSNEEFEWYVTQCHKYFNSTCTENNPFEHKVSNEMYGGDFAGIVFRRRTPENGNMIDIFTGKDYSK